MGGLALTGCSGVDVFPDTDLPSPQVHPGAIQGSVFGGHAPIVGAHVYVLEAGSGGYASAAISELTTGDATDANGTYVLTDSSGNFNVGGDYTCDLGHPVYLAATGGSPVANPTVAITAASFTETGNSGKYTVTFTATNTFTAGELLTFAGLSVANGYSQLTGTTQTVTAATGTTFTIQFTGAHGSLSGSTTGTAIYGVNSAIANMAVVGLCPGVPGEFTGMVKFVYMNEVSTIAAAYGFAPFGSGPFNVGASSTNLLGMQNAAINAGQLYDITGSSLSTTQDGEGHIARQHTPAPNGYTSNGNVPQALLDSLGDIISSCVDSLGNTFPQCTTLFTYATANGKTTGTLPTDTATAAFNIAHYPAGVDSPNFMSKLYQLQSSGVVPFTPNLTTQPNDFSVAIQYPQSLNAHMGNPESIAVDGSGNVFFSNQSTGYITKFTATGFPSFNYNSGSTPGYLSIDPTGSPTTPANNNIWFGEINGNSAIDELSNAGSLTASSSSTFSTVSANAIDSSGNFYFISATPTFNVDEFTKTFGAAPSSPFSGSGTCIPSGVTYDHMAVDASQQLWVSDEHGGVVCRFSTVGGVFKNFPVNVGNYPEAISIDSNAAAWVSVQNSNQVDKITIQNGNGNVNVTTLTSNTTGATFSEPFSSTVDGLGNIWVTNRTGNSIAELTNAGVAISPIKNYEPISFALNNSLNDPLNVAIDGSGDVWISNYGGQAVVEMIGAAAPVQTPLSYATGSTIGLGARP
jgi:streptogramin lyase